MPDVPKKIYSSSDPARQSSICRRRAKLISDTLDDLAYHGEAMTKAEWMGIYEKLIKLPFLEADGYAYYAFPQDYK